MDFNNISKYINSLDYVIHAYFVLVVGFSVLVSVFWVVYLLHELVCIRRRYRRAMNDVITFETEAVISDMKFRFVKNLVMMLICLFEIVAPISWAISTILTLVNLPIEYVSFAYLICISSIFLVFSLLNIITAYLIRAYRCTPDPRQDKRSTVLFLFKLALSIALSAMNCLIFISSLLIYILFIREFIILIVKGRLLDRVIGWKQQDLALEIGSEGRVLAIKKMRRQYRWLKNIFIVCSISLILSLPAKPINLYLTHQEQMPVGIGRDILMYYFQMSPIVREWLMGITTWLDNCLALPLTVLALVYLIYTVYYFSAGSRGSINFRLNISCFNRTTSQPSIKRPFLP